MRKLLIGPALLVAAYIAGSIYGSSAQHVVHKQPSTVFSAVTQSLTAAAGGATMTFEGKTIPYKLDYDSTPDEQLTVRLMMNGRQGAETHVLFTPQNGGKDTLITAKVKADHSVLRQELAGTSKARVAYAPDWMLNIALRPVLRQLGEQIEKGETVGAMMGFGGNEPEAQLTPEEQQLESKWRQYEASRPMVDPDEAAKNYLDSEDR